MELNKQPLLSICIPTYNRAEILQKNLILLLQHKNFDENVEIIISDNASTDNTPTIVNNIIKSHPKANIRYSRNKENIKDDNFIKVLALGSGTYLKLLNDYTNLTEEGLKIMKETIKKYEGENCNLYFFNSLRSPHSHKKEIYIESIDELVKTLNNKLTWISNFGIWKKDLSLLMAKKFNSKLQLLQMMWILFLQEYKSSVIINYKEMRNLPVPYTSRSPYNFFTPHIENYYNILEEYKNRGLISQETLSYDKKRTLSDFPGRKIVEYLIYKEKCNFDLSNSWKIIYNKYGHEKALYILIIKAYLYYPLHILKKIIPKKYKQFIKKIF